MDTGTQAEGDRPQDGAGVAVGRVARGDRTGCVGLVLAVEGRRVRLRSLATGRVWEADAAELRPVGAREALSLRIAAANARARARGPR